MPVYLCQPGQQTAEPWRHGIQVYAHPFLLEGDEIEISLPAAPQQPHEETNKSRLPEDGRQDDDDGDATRQRVNTHTRSRSSHKLPPQQFPIRRVRHAEVVLVDDVSLAYGRYWLRLRWPGKSQKKHSLFAGYIALGKMIPNEVPYKIEDSVTSSKLVTTNSPKEEESERQSEMPPPRLAQRYVRQSTGNTDFSVPDEGATLVVQPQEESPQPEEEEEEHDGYFRETVHEDEVVRDDGDGDDDDDTPEGRLQCLRTGLYFPSSSALQLLYMYNDGLSNIVSTTSLQQSQEPIFCRICREGLHEDEEQAPEEGAKEEDTSVVQEKEPEEDSLLEGPSAYKSTGPTFPHPPYHSNHYAAENPLLAPCECSGSMAFVHYLCIEQWRCRSRHPKAQQGLHCETCSAPYALPPPSSRPSTTSPHPNNIINEEDWLEAMPAHVMAALRQPHFVWQVGAALIRRRWLRPLAPVLVSPLVALYCRARRLLKKRGVSRRRWACSLCRRRARWKCVRCLRSYYCSRQCQNVSWHIVHKHVCYKPARFWWSVVVYGSVVLCCMPGIRTDPLVYDFGAMLLPLSFLVMGILGGGVATVVKKCAGVDWRGRVLELVVVGWTLWLFSIMWGLVWAFFGEPGQCVGVLSGDAAATADTESKISTMVHTTLKLVVFSPLERWFQMWDGLFLKSPRLLRAHLCPTYDSDGEEEPLPSCFVHVPNLDFLEEKKCAADLDLVVGLCLAAGAVLVASTLYKKHERRVRARARAARRHHHHRQEAVHLHQD